MTLVKDSTKLSEKLSQYKMPMTLFNVIPLGDNLYAHVKLLLPPEIVQGHKYPLVVRVYAGPGTVRVKDNYDLGKFLSVLGIFLCHCILTHIIKHIFKRVYHQAGTIQILFVTGIMILANSTLSRGPNYFTLQSITTYTWPRIVVLLWGPSTCEDQAQ